MTRTIIKADDLKVEQPAAPDPFDLDALRISQDFQEIGVKQVLITVPVRRPHRQDFFRVHPGEDFVLDTAVIEISEDREYFLVSPEIRSELFSEVKPVRLFTTINRQGVVALWPARLPDQDGRTSTWYSTALSIAEHAKTRWCRMVADRSLGGYQLYEAGQDLPDPTWPEQNFKALLKLAFGNGSYVDNPDHIVIRRLMGQV
jgi:hypothetical protein